LGARFGYQISNPKKQLLQNKVNLINFFFKENIFCFGDRGVIFFSLVYLLPFLFYVILYFSPAKKITESILSRFKKKIIKFFYAHLLWKPLLVIYSIVKIKIIGNLDLILFAVVLINIFFVPVIKRYCLNCCGCVMVLFGKVLQEHKQKVIYDRDFSYFSLPVYFVFSI